MKNESFESLVKILYSAKETGDLISLSEGTLYNNVSLARKGKAAYLIRPRYQGKRLLFHVDDIKAYAASLPREIQVIRKRKPKGGNGEGDLNYEP